MGLFKRDISFIIITCDLCRRTEHRAHEAVHAGDMQDYLRKNEERATGSLPGGWSVIRKGRPEGDPHYICPPCVKSTASGER